MRVLETIQAVLQAFLDLLTQPFEQDPQAALKAAAASIALVGAAGGTIAAGNENTIQGIGGPSLVIVLVWDGGDRGHRQSRSQTPRDRT